jgi:hypothetical protein
MHIHHLTGVDIFTLPYSMFGKMVLNSCLALGKRAFPHLLKAALPALSLIKIRP